MKRLTGLALLLLLGCDFGLKGEAKDSVRRSMLDPDAAQFRDLEFCGDNVLMGYVNGKNAFGAYTGFKMFVYEDGRSAVFGDPFFYPLLERCVGKEAADQIRAMNASERPEPLP